MEAVPHSPVCCAACAMCTATAAHACASGPLPLRVHDCVCTPLTQRHSTKRQPGRAAQCCALCHSSSLQLRGRLRPTWHDSDVEYGGDRVAPCGVKALACVDAVPVGAVHAGAAVVPASLTLSL